MSDLTPREIYSLNKVQGRMIGDTAYADKELIEKFCSYGLLCVGTTEQSLEFSDMNILRKLLKEKGLKAGGKKVDLVQRVLQNYSHAELEGEDIPKRYIHTEAGKQLVDQNKALLLYLSAFGSTNRLDVAEIIASQRAYPGDDEYDILIRLFKEKADAEKADTVGSIGSKRVFLAYLQKVYFMKHDEVLANETESIIEELDKLWEEAREREQREWCSAQGISYEEHRRLVEKAMEEIGDE